MTYFIQWSLFSYWRRTWSLMCHLNQIWIKKGEEGREDTIIFFNCSTIKRGDITLVRKHIKAQNSILTLMVGPKNIYKKSLCTASFTFPYRFPLYTNTAHWKRQKIMKRAVGEFKDSLYFALRLNFWAIPWFLTCLIPKYMLYELWPQ